MGKVTAPWLTSQEVPLMCDVAHMLTHINSEDCIMCDTGMTKPSLSFLVLLSPQERIFLTVSNYIFTAIFVTEMTIKVGGNAGICLRVGSLVISDGGLGGL